MPSLRIVASWQNYIWPALSSGVLLGATVIPFQDSQLRVVGREDSIDAEHAWLGAGDVLELLRKLVAAFGPEALERMLAR